MGTSVSAYWCHVSTGILLKICCKLYNFTWVDQIFLWGAIANPQKFVFTYLGGVCNPRM